MPSRRTPLPLLLSSFALVLASCVRGAPPVTAPGVPAAALASPEVRACRHWVEEYRVPRCVGEIEPEARAKRESYYLLHYQGGRATQVDYQFRGRPYDAGDCPISKYVQVGDTVEQTCEDGHGVIRKRARYEADGAHVYWLDRSGRARFDGESDAAGVLRDIDPAGRVIGYRYIGMLGAPEHNADAVYRVRPTRAAAGHLIEESYWDADDRPMLGGEGAHIIRYEDDRDLNPVRRRYFGLRGEPVLTTDGYHEARTVRDAVGNDMGQSYWDDRGSPANSAEGTPAYEIRRDARGFEVSRTYLDASGRPTLNRYGYATRRIEYDDEGREVRWSHYGVDGQPCLRREGNWAKEVTYDAQDRIVAESYLGIDGRLRELRGGFARMTTEYDKHGNAVLRSYFDAAGLPGHSGGYAAVRSGYDDDARLVGTTYLDRDGRPTDLEAGYARIELTLDGRGRVTKRTYLDKSGSPVPIVTIAYILVQYAGALDAPARITRSKETAKARAKEALGWLRAGADFDKVEARWSDPAYDYGSAGPMRVMLHRLKPEWTAIVPSLRIGVESEVIELKSGLWILKRLP